MQRLMKTLRGAADPRTEAQSSGSRSGDFDLAKVNHVRRLIRAGQYRVDADGIADRILVEALVSRVHDCLAAVTPRQPAHA